MTHKMRMAAYYACTLCWQKPRVSSEEIAACTGTNASQVRRDLSALGKFGRRGVGYEARLLSFELDGVVLGDELEETVARVLQQQEVYKNILKALDPDGDIRLSLEEPEDE